MKSTIFALALVLVVVANCNAALPLKWIDEKFRDVFKHFPFGVGKVEMPRIYRRHVFCGHDYITGYMDMVSQQIVLYGLESFETVACIKGSNSTHNINSCTFKVPKAGVHCLLNETGVEEDTNAPFSGTAHYFSGSLILLEDKLTSDLTLGGFDISLVRFYYTSTPDPLQYDCFSTALWNYGQGKEFASPIENLIMQRF